MTTFETLQAEMTAALDAYKAHLTEDYAAWDRQTPYFKEGRAEAWAANIAFQKGQKFIKVVEGSRVHSFIVVVPFGSFKYGAILKAASWAAPAKNFARGNVIDRDFSKTSWTGC